jgi:hypothetical protein
MGAPLPRILTYGLGAMAVISTLAVLGATDGRPVPEWGPSTPKSRASADRILAAKSRDINRASVGETRVAAFLGAEFGMSEQEIVEERMALGASWGNFTIAHTLATSDKQGMTVAQVLQLHDSGLEWGQVAAGLGMNLDDVVRAVATETHVAMGRAHADGKVAPIRER